LTDISRETYDQDSKQALTESGKNTRRQYGLSVEKVSYFDQQRLIINLILRYQLIQDKISSQTDNFGTVTPGFNNTFHLPGPQLGAKYRFSNRTFLTANVGLYDRAPSFFELFGGEGLLLGNSDLKKESSLNSDAGITYRLYKPYNWLHDTELYAGVFYNRIKNLIVRIYNGQGIGVPENISDADVGGFESSIKMHPLKQLSVTANMTLTYSENKTNVASFSGKDLPGYYRQRYGLRFAYALNKWLYSADANIKRKMYYDRSNLLKGDNVNRIDLALRRYFKNSSVDFRIDNILNEHVEYFRNRPTPGTSLSLTYNYNF